MGTDRRALLVRTGKALGLVLLTVIGFELTGRGIDPAAATPLRPALDDAIPFLPHSVWFYSWVYTTLLLPLFVVRCPELFHRLFKAYVIVIVVTLASFALFPVTSLGFRPDPSQIPDDAFHLWAVRLTFVVDPPMNLFPSLHLSIATISALSAWKAHRGAGLLAALIAVGVAITICTMKQHYIADGVSALLLAFVAYALTLRGYDSSSNPDRAYSWRGPAAYLLFHGLFYMTFICLYLAGWKPW